VSFDVPVPDWSCSTVRIATASRWTASWSSARWTAAFCRFSSAFASASSNVAPLRRSAAAADRA
jgi:hypothetical protein